MGVSPTGALMLAAAGVAVVWGAVFVYTHPAFGPRDAGSYAEGVAERQAEQVEAGLARHDHGDAESVAKEIRQTPLAPASGVRVAVLAWSDSLAGEQATVDVRFTVTALDDNRLPVAGEASLPEITVVRCFRYTLQRPRHVGHHEIDCPAAAGPTPTEPGVTVHPATDDGTLVAAVGVPEERTASS